jgi:putative two-component system protein, hydrogenase maturation factor HypX/HoxX
MAQHLAEADIDMFDGLRASITTPGEPRLDAGKQRRIVNGAVDGSADSVEHAGPGPRTGSNVSGVALRILFLVSAHNGLSQRAWIALTELGHKVTVAVVDSAESMEAAVNRNAPELIVCPFLKTMIPESIWAVHRCLVVHPGPQGDRGPSSLDWAIELGMPEWGVTALEANGEFDAGKVWATRSFRTREVGKSSLYRHEVRHAAIDALVEAVDQILDGGAAPTPPDRDRAAPLGQSRPSMTQEVRAIDWSSDPTDTVLRKLRAGEGHPGVLDSILGTEFHLFGAHRERRLRGRPGELIAQRDGAVCRATIDGAVWLTHLKRRDTPTDRYFKLPAVSALGLAGIEPDLPESSVAIYELLHADHTYREIVYEEQAAVGYLHFDFYNGAMSTEQCMRLREAYGHARSRSHTNVIVLMGGLDYFSNGIHLNVIEAAENPAAESWRNLRAITDLAREIIETDSHLVLSALRGDAAAGGVALALAADHVVAREDIVLNPYYQHMGGLYGSEYWTYLLPRRIGAEMTATLTNPPFTPIGAHRAARIGLLDATFGATLDSFHNHVRDFAERLADDPRLEHQLAKKRNERARDEDTKPLHAYRSEELAESLKSFFGPDPSYHHARRRFVYKLGQSGQTERPPTQQRPGAHNAFQEGWGIQMRDEVCRQRLPSD